MIKINKIFPRVFSYFFRLEYYFSSRFKYLFSRIKGTNYRKRINLQKNINSIHKKLSKNKYKRLAIFVAFHSPSQIPQSNLNYIKILKKSLFDIVYVHNGHLGKKIINKLHRIGCFVIIRENIGQDFGAWKDTISLLQEHKILDKVKWLLLCNDSNFCIGGKNLDSFIKKFNESLNEQDLYDFICLNSNFEGSLHYQSYFICLSKNILKMQKFRKFWEEYIPIDNRYHAIRNGEKKFSKIILNNLRPKIMFTSYELSENIKDKLQIDYKYLFKLLPHNLFFLKVLFENKSLNSKKNIYLSTSQLISFLENYNPSHVFGLLNIIYLNSPFLKKDVVRMGVFSINQVYEVLKITKLSINTQLKDEVMKILISHGTLLSYFEERRIAVRKGIPINKNLYEYQSNTKELKKLYFNKKNHNKKN